MTPTGFNGTYVITVTSPTTFTFTLTTNPGAATVFGTVTHRGIFTNPRFQALNGTQIYSTTLGTAGQALVNGVQQLDPRGSPRWGDYLISLLDTGFNAPAGTYANDYIAGGGADNMIFGEMGNNVIQGAGSIDYVSHLEQSLAITAASWSNGTATITTSVPHGFINDESVVLTGITPRGYNGTYTITMTSPTTFTYALTTNPGAGTAFGIVTGLDLAALGGRVGVVNANPNNIAHNPFRDINNALELFPAINLAIDAANNIADGDNYIEGGGGNNIIFGGGAQNDIIGGNSDLFSHPNPFSDIAINAASWANGAATITTSVANGFVSGESVTIAGMTPAGYNGTYVITVTSPTTFTYKLATNPGAGTAFGTVAPSNNQSSNAFNNTRTQRQSGSNLIFGDAGTDIYRNDLGSDTSANRHAQNSDMIISNNGDIFRLVGVTVNGQVMLAPPTGTGSVGGVATFNGFLAFNDDNYSPQLKIIPRAAKLRDYTPGGPAYAPTSAQSLLDIGGMSEIHAENGDAFIFGEAGRQYTPTGYNGQIFQSLQYGNVIFGGNGDDQVVGGYGNNWISGGTGAATIIGQDGRISVSRNGLSEPLNGVTAIPANQLNKEIFTPGHIQDAIINVAGQLKSTVDLEPFSEDATFNASQPEWNFGFTAPHQSDDIIFAGLGNTTVHGGSGDDAISGGQALSVSYLQTEDHYSGNLTGIAESDWYHPYNPGDTLRFNPIDPSGTHPPKEVGRTGQFALYNEFDPRRKILLNGDGTANKTGTGLAWFLDLNAAEKDGNDALFGDLGNNWIVSGTGQNDLYGGFGNDLLDARSSQDIDGGLNDLPDYAAKITNRAFGGAGKDVLIADNAANRLIDWVGNFNTYIVPFAPWGMPTVSRTVQPQLPQFLYALSQSDGADETLAADNGTDPARNGEPAGEMGLVLQHDAAWHQETGAPSDHPPGNIGGVPRVVMKSASLSGQATSFFPDSGTWSVSSSGYTGSAAVGSDAVSLLYLDQWQPNYLEFFGTVRLGGANNRKNGFLIFDYQSPTNFRYAGIDGTSNLLRIGQRTASGWIDDATLSYGLSGNSPKTFEVILNGTTAQLVINNTTLQYNFPDALNVGMLGLGLNGTSDSFTSYTVQTLARVFTYQESPAVTSTGLTGFTVQSGHGSVNSTASRYLLTPPVGGAALSTRPLNVASSSYVEFQATVNAAANGTWAGLAFAYTSPNDFYFAAVVPGTNQVLLGHRNPMGWFIDAVTSQTITAGTDYTLLVALDNSPFGGIPPTATVVLNGKSVLSYTYNLQLAGGPMQGNLQLGLLAQYGVASFYNVSIRGDDPAYAGGGTPQLAAVPAPVQTATVSPLTAAQLQPIVQAAIARWEGSPALHGNDQLLQQARVTIATLPGSMLGETIGNSIVIDPTAAGYGWFVDSTPLEDSEFHRSNVNGLLVANTSSPAFGHMDLETVVLHELGHVLGLDDVDLPAGTTDLMATYLKPGVRRLPDGLSPVPDSAMIVPTTPLADPAHPAAPSFSASAVMVSPGWMRTGLPSDRPAARPLLDALFTVGVRANVQVPQGLVGSSLLLNPAFWAGMSGNPGVESSRQWQLNAYFLFSRSSREDWIPDGMVAASLDRDGLGHSSIRDWIFAESDMGAPLDQVSESAGDVVSDPTWPGWLGR
jgi:Ca2+-binding RTX toxin-like protein